MSFDITQEVLTLGFKKMLTGKADDSVKCE